MLAIEKVGTFLRNLSIKDIATEREHLKELSDRDASGMADKVKELISQGKPYRQVATEMRISLSKVQRLLKK
jgi:transposase-like protein